MRNARNYNKTAMTRIRVIEDLRISLVEMIEPLNQQGKNWESIRFWAPAKCGSNVRMYTSARKGVGGYCGQASSSNKRQLQARSPRKVNGATERCSMSTIEQVFADILRAAGFTVRITFVINIVWVYCSTIFFAPINVQTVTSIPAR